ncbi:aldose epimerase family protein [uncultured Jannaschia sp.]|uniref:aldose epimerase family protein n=1 Tax=uncultured Jannaschia sp. TaxID=293347 RepID=UPI002632122F|nr:aldose epimerase family protein [uncultured Jannaschia sp.]
MELDRYTITGHGLTATFVDWGATLLDLRLDGHDAPLVLGLERPEDYVAGHAEYMGATVGRVANRIGDARFTLDGATYRTDPNFRDRHTLHGGVHGTGNRLWKRVDRRDDAVRFALDLADGDMGFPGRMRIEATFACAADATLSVRYRATAEAPTPCNIAHHSYWNLDGKPTLADHVLTVAADRYVPVDDDLIPTGVAPVEGTALDFRRGRGLPGEGLLDHNLCLSDGKVAPREVAWLRAGNLTMTIATDQPGLQVYDGALLDVPVPGIGGRSYGPHAGVAIEAQGWPDAVNRDDFPDNILRPGETYEQTTTFSFTKE